MVIVTRDGLTLCKCTGTRPKCQECSSRGIECIYSADPDAPPSIALKRKYEALERQSAEEHEMLNILRSSSDEDAVRALMALRSSENLTSVLDQTRQAPVSPTYSRSSSSKGSRPELITLAGSTGSASELHPSPTILGQNAGPQWVLPIDPHVGLLPALRSASIIEYVYGIRLGQSQKLTRSFRRSMNDPSMESTSPRGSTRRTPSDTALIIAPSAGQNELSNDILKGNDPRLADLKASDWDIDVPDTAFRNIFSCLFAWDHPDWPVLDEAEFINALSGRPSELGSRLLVCAALAYGAVGRSSAESMIELELTSTDILSIFRHGCGQSRLLNRMG